MANSTSFVLTRKSQDSFIQYYRETLLTVNATQTSQRNKFIDIDRAYMRENDTTDHQTQAKRANKAGNQDVLQNVTVPIVMPQVEAAVVYQASVFLTGVPIFGVVANDEFMDAALQMETILDDNAELGGWTRELMMFFRDGFKYNMSAIEVSWDKETVASIETDIEFSPEQGKPVDTIWSGNKLKHLSVYNTFADPRVAPTECYKKGEFAGYTEFLSRIELKEFVSSMSGSITMNITKAFESSSSAIPGTTTQETAEAFFIPDINPEQSIHERFEGNMNWLSWAGLGTSGQTAKNMTIKYKNTYEKTTLYCKVLPSEFDLKVPAKNTPQIWKLIIINHEVIIYAERQTNAHGWIPILIGQPYEDGLEYQTKSLARNSKQFQELTSAFMNANLESRRRSISDRVLFDPSRILSAHINAKNSAAKIPVRPAAYGKNVADAVYQFPYREDQQANNMSQIRELVQMSNILAGQNPARQGQFTKGNRTKSEFEDIMANANGRDQLVSILYEAQVFTPMKTIFKLDILQYQGAATLYSREKETAVEIDPLELRKAILKFKISDGLVPSDKIISTDDWATALQVLGTNPELGRGFNLAPMFSYMMKVRGAMIHQFEKSPEQVAYEQALTQWQQVAITVAEKGGDLKSIPQPPLPQDFGYNPAGQDRPEAAEPAAGELPDNRVNPQ